MTTKEKIKRPGHRKSVLVAKMTPPAWIKQGKFRQLNVHVTPVGMGWIKTPGASTVTKAALSKLNPKVVAGVRLTGAPTPKMIVVLTNGIKFSRALAVNPLAGTGKKFRTGKTTWKSHISRKVYVKDRDDYPEEGFKGGTKK